VKIGSGTGLGSVHALPASLVTVKEEFKVGAWTPRDQAPAPDGSFGAHAHISCLSMIFSENRYPLFRIMLHGSNPPVPAVQPNCRSARLNRIHAKRQESIDSKPQRHAGPDK
jgi:hypothetical protein